MAYIAGERVDTADVPAHLAAKAAARAAKPAAKSAKPTATPQVRRFVNAPIEMLREDMEIRKAMPTYRRPAECRDGCEHVRTEHYTLAYSELPRLRQAQQSPPKLGFWLDQP